MPLVWYDCACTLHRFVRNKIRCKKTRMARLLSRMNYVVDKFHFRKGHKGCAAGGINELAAVWPQTYALRFPHVNDSACEQSFAQFRKMVGTARNMSPSRCMLYLLLVVHEHNVYLESKTVSS